MATSFRISTNIPPKPHTMTGPNMGSFLIPRITSTPSPAILWTRIPVILAAGRGFLLLVGCDERPPNALRRRNPKDHPAHIFFMLDRRGFDLQGHRNPSRLAVCTASSTV